LVKENNIIQKRRRNKLEERWNTRVVVEYLLLKKCVSKKDLVSTTCDEREAESKLLTRQLLL